MAEFAGKAVERLAPVMDVHGPFFSRPFQGQIIQFDQPLLVGGAEWL